MSQQNSKRIMVETISKVTAVAIIIAMVIGIAVLLKQWDKIFSIEEPFESEEESLTQPKESEGTEPSQADNAPSEEPAITLTGNSNEMQPAESDLNEEEPDQPQESSQDEGTNNEEDAYNKEIASEIVAIASEQLGVPFKSGGSSPEEGFDSTGFTYYCVNEAGVKFPRNLKDQLESGAWVSYDELAAGDIVYFSAEPGGNATFCGVYLGGGLIIYSPVPDEFVKTANITTNYWTTHFVTGLRVTSQTNG